MESCHTTGNGTHWVINGYGKPISVNCTILRPQTCIEMTSCGLVPSQQEDLAARPKHQNDPQNRMRYILSSPHDYRHHSLPLINLSRSIRSRRWVHEVADTKASSAPPPVPHFRRPHPHPPPPNPQPLCRHGLRHPHWQPRARNSKP